MSYIAKLMNTIRKFNLFGPYAFLPEKSFECLDQILATIFITKFKRGKLEFNFKNLNGYESCTSFSFLKLCSMESSLSYSTMNEFLHFSAIFFTSFSKFAVHFFCFL